MKSTNRIISILLLLFLIPGSVLIAQDDQLKQDLRIGEKILSELITDNGEDFLFLGRAPRVMGEYIEGYGVHYVLGAGTSTRGIMARVFSRMESDDESHTPENNSDRIESIMRDYLQNYAVVSRHLSDNEHVRLTYNPQRSTPGVFIMSNSRVTEERIDVPNISVWATAADLKSHRNGTISDDDLQQRITVQNISRDDIGNDLNVFSSVLRTSLENVQTEHLRVGRDIRFDYIPGLGAHYHLNISTGGIFGRSDVMGIARQVEGLNLGNLPNIEINLGEIKIDSADQMKFNSPQIEFKLDSSRVYIRGLHDSLRVDLDEIRKQAEEARRQGERVRGQADEIRRQFAFNVAENDTIDYSDDAEKIMAQLNEVIADYGQTLRSLSDGEQLMITVNWRGRNLPERTTLRITKEDLLNGRTPTVTEY